MADIINCPGCQKEVSRHALNCRNCWKEIADVPEALTLDLLAGLRDEDLPEVIDQYMLRRLDEAGCYERDGPRECDVLMTFPQGLRAAYLLISLSSEVSNGGFYQWFTNSSGQSAELTLTELRALGDVKTADVVEQALVLNRQMEERYPGYQDRWNRESGPLPEGFWEDVETNFMPALNPLETVLSDLEDAPDSMWTSLCRFVRQHPEFCLHRPARA